MIPIILGAIIRNYSFIQITIKFGNILSCFVCRCKDQSYGRKNSVFSIKKHGFRHLSDCRNYAFGTERPIVGVKKSEILLRRFFTEDP